MAIWLDDLEALLATHRDARRRLAPALAALMPPDGTARPDPAGLAAGLATLARKQHHRQAETEQAFLADLVTTLFWEDPATAPLDDTVALCDRLPGLIAAPIVSALCAARRLAALGDGAGAIAGYEPLLTDAATTTPIAAAIATDLFRLGRRERALRVLADQCIGRGYVDPDSPYFLGCLLAHGNIGRLQSIHRRRCEDGLAPRADTVALARHRAADGVPTVLLVTLPKSGSVYLAEEASRVLGAPMTTIAVRGFPRDGIVPELAAAVAGGGFVVQEHTDPSPANLAALRTAGLTRVHVHVRDPRQSTVSWLHHVDRMWRDPYGIGRLSEPEAYGGWDWSRKVQHQADTWFPAAVAWIGAWAAAATADNGITVQFSEFRDLKHDGVGTLRRMLAFFGVAPDRLPTRTAAADTNRHFRRGATEEWRQVFSAAQQRQMLSVLPDALCDRFGWSRTVGETASPA